MTYTDRMTYQEGVLFGLLGSALYQLVDVYTYRGKQRKWPWADKKLGLDGTYFLFGSLVKLIAAAGLSGMLVYTSQINGAWAAFLSGMVADQIIIKLGHSALEARSK